MPNTEDDVAPAPRRGRPRDPERVRRTMEAAHSHFNAHGLERASVDAIAADAGVSKMTIYSHFASKEGLFEAVIRGRTDRVMGGLAGVEALDPDAASEGAAGRRRAVPRAGARRGHAGPVSLDLWNRRGAARGVLGALQTGSREVDRRPGVYLRRADAVGALNIRHPRQGADLFLSMFLGDGHIRGLMMLDTPDARENRALLREAVRGKVRSILDWFHVSIRVRSEQIVAGLHNRSETELYTKRILAELVSKLRWHFWHANSQKAWDKLRAS